MARSLMIVFENKKDAFCENGLSETTLILILSMRISSEPRNRPRVFDSVRDKELFI